MFMLVERHEKSMLWFLVLFFLVSKRVCQEYKLRLGASQHFN